MFDVPEIWIKIWKVKTILNNLMQSKTFYDLYPPSSIRHQNTCFSALSIPIYRLWIVSNWIMFLRYTQPTNQDILNTVTRHAMPRYSCIWKKMCVCNMTSLIHEHIYDVYECIYISYIDIQDVLHTKGKHFYSKIKLI